MPLSTMLFSFTERLNRARFWLSSILLFVVGLFLLPIHVLSWVLITTSPLSIPALIAVKGWSVMPTASAGLIFALLVYLLVIFADLLMSFASLAVAIKRLHDRDKSAWWLLVPWILLTIAYYTLGVELRPILGLAGLAIAIWLFVELGFLRGTAGPNRYGPDPLQIASTGSAGAAARVATIALLTLTGAGFIAELALPVVLVQHGRWWRILSEISSSRRPQATLAYSDFLNDVTRNQVADVTIQGNTINGHFTDGRAFSTYAPNDPDLVNRLTTKGVRITAAPLSPRIPAAPNKAQRQPQPPAAPNEAHRQPQLPAAANVAAESGVTGVWTAYDVGFPPWTLILNADGAKLSGTVQQGAGGSSGYTTLAMPAAIYDGEIEGNKITFKCQDPWLHERTITFAGIVNGDAITFTRAVLVKSGGRPGSNGIFGASGAAEFTARRVVPAGAASAPAEPDRGHRDLGGDRFVEIDISRVANSELDWLQRPPRGHVTFDGIPFTILSGDRAVIHMHNRVRPDYPATLRFPIGVAAVARVHLLLCGDWISNPGQNVGTVRVSYSDGSFRNVPLISLEDIRETWMPNFSLLSHPSSRPPGGVTWNAAYSESQTRGGMASTAFLDRLSIRTDPARTINDVSFLTNEPQTGMILIAMTLEITPPAVPPAAASAPAKPH
jgi:uncharacterized membrane protein YhaH (DUF805 family)